MTLDGQQEGTYKHALKIQKVGFCEAYPAVTTENWAMLAN